VLAELAGLFQRDVGAGLRVGTCRNISISGGDLVLCNSPFIWLMSGSAAGPFGPDCTKGNCGCGVKGEYTVGVWNTDAGNED
jgi:hypothetical protein